MPTPKIGPAVLVVVAGLTLGGCSWQEVVEKAVEVYRDVQEGVGLTKAALQGYCADAQAAATVVENLAAQTASCKIEKPVKRVVAGLEGACRSVDVLDPSDLRTVITAVKKGAAEIKEAAKKGC